MKNLNTTRLAAILKDEGLVSRHLKRAGPVIPLPMAEIREFIELFIAGKIKNLPDYMSRVSGVRKHSWGMAQRFQRSQPAAWKKFKADVKAYKAQLKEERKLWRVQNADLPRRERLTWVEHFDGIGDGAHSSLTNRLLDTKWKAEELGGIRRWLHHVNGSWSGSTKWEDSPSAWG